MIRRFMKYNSMIFQSYFLTAVEVMYSENAFPNGDGTDIKTISTSGLKAFATDKVFSKIPTNYTITKI